MRRFPHTFATWAIENEARELDVQRLLGHSTPAMVRRYSATYDAEKAARAALSANREFDVTALLPQVKSPTLVLHRRQVPYPNVGLARDLASRITDARLAVVEGTAVAPHMGDMEAVLAAINEFLGDDEFGVIMPETDRRGAFVVATRIRRMLEVTSVCERDGQSLKLSVSLGVSGFPWDGQSGDELVQKADTAMYVVKANRPGTTDAPTPTPSEAGLTG